MIQYIERFLEMMASERGCARQTLEAYGRDLVKWAFFVGNTPLSSIDPSHKKNYIDYLASCHLSPRSIARHLSALRQFFHFLLVEGLVTQDPWKGHAPRYICRLPRVLTTSEIRLVLTYVNRDMSPEGRRLWALLEMLYATGMRVSELIALPFANFASLPLQNNEVHSILIRGKGGHERIVFFTPHAITAIDAYLKVRSFFVSHGSHGFNPYLFPSRARQGYLTRQRVGQLFKEVAEACDIDPERLTPHSIRHAFATHLMHQGIDLVVLKQLLGHQDISTTQIYTHVNSEHWAKLLQEYHPLARQ